LSSCVHATGDKITALGGKGAYRSKSFTLVYGNEKSFRDAALAVTTIAASVASAYTTAAAETTAQVASGNAASVTNTSTKAAQATAINSSNNATKIAIKELEVIPVAP